MNRPSRTRIAAAFAAVYLIWGSTYLAIRACVQTMPPFLMAGARFLLAGGALYAWARATGAPRPERAHWKSAALVGALLVVAGNGLVVWSERRLPSSTAALLIAMAPVWFALLAWLIRGERPTAMRLAGIAIGLSGIALLVGGGAADAHGVADPAGTAALLVASLAWAAGSLLARELPLPASPLLSTGLQLLCGGALALVVGFCAGEYQGFALAGVGAASWAAWAYLIVFGTLVGFTAYSWLNRVVSPAALSTYAYVNPLVALLLGATLGGEALTARTLAAAAVILAGVALMSVPRRPEQESRPPATARALRVA